MDIEKILLEERKTYDSLQPPEDLELRLTRALACAPVASRKSWQLPLVASFVLLFLLAGFNYDTLAYYGHRLMGYEGVMTETLQELRDQAKGQIIGQSYTLADGTKVTLDGIMADDNQMIAFYQLAGPNLTDEAVQHQVFLNSSLHRALFQGMTAQLQGKDTYYCMATFPPAHFYQRSFAFELVTKEGEQATIPFKLSRTQAMGSYYHQQIKAKIAVPPMEMQLEELTASATQTRIEGRVDSVASFAIKELTGQDSRIHQTEWVLQADGNTIPCQGGEWRTDPRGTTFALRFDPLPTQTKKIDLTLKEITFLLRPDFRLPLDRAARPQHLSYGGQEITILGWEVKDEQTHVYVQAAKNTSILEVYLKDGEEKLIYQATRYHEKNPLTGQALPHVKEIIFTGTGENLSLEIGQMLCKLTPENNTVSIAIK